MRLVPDQDPEKIVAAFEQSMRDRCPRGLKIEFARHGLAGPVLVPREGYYHPSPTSSPGVHPIRSTD